MAAELCCPIKIIQTVNVNCSLTNNFVCVSFLIKTNFTVASTNIQKKYFLVAEQVRKSPQPISLNYRHKQGHNIILSKMCVCPCGGKIDHKDFRIQSIFIHFFCVCLHTFIWSTHWLKGTSLIFQLGTSLGSCFTAPSSPSFNQPQPSSLSCLYEGGLKGGTGWLRWSRKNKLLWWLQEADCLSRAAGLADPVGRHIVSASKTQTKEKLCHTWLDNHPSTLIFKRERRAN